MSDPILQAAIIGCGNIGATHANSLRTIPGVRIAAFCDQHLVSAQALSALSPEAYITEDIDRVLNDAGIQAVIIATHNDSHVPMALKAIRNGKAVLLEKPMSLDLDSALRLAREVEARNVPLMMGFKLRFEPAIERAREFLPSPYLTAGHLHDSPWPEEGWFMDPQKGGGNILSQGCHMADLVCYLNPAPPVRIHAEGGNLQHPKSPLYDNLVCSIRFANNAIASLMAGDSGPAPVVSKFSALMTADNRAVLIHDRMKSVSFYENQRSWEERAESEQGFINEVRAFIAALRTGGPLPCNHRDGLLSVLLLDRAYQSIRTGTAQAIPSIEELLKSRPSITVPASSRTLRIGIVGGMQASHCKVFSSILNGVPEGATLPEGFARYPQRDLGARVTAAWDPDSAAAAKLAGAYGLEHVSQSLEEMAGCVDAAIICDDRSMEHAKRAEPFLRAGKPVYVDKLFGSNYASSLPIVKLTQEHRAPCFAASALRFARELEEARQQIEKIGPVKLLTLTGPGDLVWYGIHLLEVAFPLLGSDVEALVNTGQGAHNNIRARYRNGVDLLINISEEYPYGFHCHVLGTKGHFFTTIGDAVYFYTNLMEAAVAMFHGGPVPVDPEESLKIMYFLDVAAKSKSQGGTWIPL